MIPLSLFPKELNLKYSVDNFEPKTAQKYREFMRRLICSLGTQAKLCANYFVLGESEKDTIVRIHLEPGKKKKNPNISPQNYPFKGTQT